MLNTIAASLKERLTGLALGTEKCSIQEINITKRRFNIIFYILLIGSYWCWMTVSHIHKNTCSLHFFVTVDKRWHRGFSSTYYMQIQINKVYSSMFWMSLRDKGHITLTAKVSNKRSQETTAKKKKKRLRGLSETTGPLYYDSYSLQLISHTTGWTILASHSSLRSLLSARTKLRTTGLLTGWGKMMRMLACHL